MPGGSEGLYFVSAFGGLLAPHWREDARGTLVGLTLAHDRRHVARAVLEGIAFQASGPLHVAVTRGRHATCAVLEAIAFQARGRNGHGTWDMGRGTWTWTWNMGTWTWTWT